jgi:hypothetical protein
MRQVAEDHTVVAQPIHGLFDGEVVGNVLGVLHHVLDDAVVFRPPDQALGVPG